MEKQAFKRMMEDTVLTNLIDFSSHTAYHLAFDGGFLIDGKINNNKQLTELRKIFIESMRD